MNEAGAEQRHNQYPCHTTDASQHTFSSSSLKTLRAAVQTPGASPSGGHTPPFTRSFSMENDFVLEI
jgi:hypothetical protein